MNQPETPKQTVIMRPEWLRAIAKAASSIRFTSNEWEWMTEAAKEESRSIADTLTEIENAYLEGIMPEYIELNMSN